MANLTLKNIPNELYDCLKEAASQHHRSINSELRNVLSHYMRKEIIDFDTVFEIQNQAEFLLSENNASNKTYNTH